MSETTVLTIVGSLRRGSVNRQLRNMAAELGPAGIRVTGWDGLAAVPAFNQDDETYPGVVVAGLRRAIGAADAVLLVTPEYNGSLPGQLKNALDWASRPVGASALTAKPVAVIGASPSPGGTASAQEHARTVLTRAGACPVETGLVVPHTDDTVAWDAGAMPEPWLHAGLQTVFADLARAAGSATELDTPPVLVPARAK